MSDHERAVEAREVFARLASGPQGRLFQTIVADPACCTAGGKINCSAAARQLGIDDSAVRRMISEARVTAKDWA